MRIEIYNMGEMCEFESLHNTVDSEFHIRDINCKSSNVTQNGDSHQSYSGNTWLCVH